MNESDGPTTIGKLFHLTDVTFYFSEYELPALPKYLSTPADVSDGSEPFVSRCLGAHDRPQRGIGGRRGHRRGPSNATVGPYSHVAQGAEGGSETVAVYKSDDEEPAQQQVNHGVRKENLVSVHNRKLTRREGKKEEYMSHMYKTIFVLSLRHILVKRNSKSK